MHRTFVLLLLSGSAWADPAAVAPLDPAVRCAATATWDKAACAGQVEAARKTFEAAKTQLAALPDCATLPEAERPTCEATATRLKAVRAEAREVAGIEPPKQPARSNNNRMEGESTDE